MDGIKGIGSPEGASSLQQFRYMLQAIQDVRTGKVAREDAIEKTVLRYRLDLDERGVLKSAKPSDSQRAVTNQEQSNVRRLSTEAQARGEDVVAVDVDYEAKIVDGKLAIVAGHTEVTSMKGRPAGPPRVPVVAATDEGDDEELTIPEQMAKLITEAEAAAEAAGADAAATTGNAAADYLRIGAANQAAAASGRLLDLNDDATLRGLSGGLEPVEEPNLG